MQRASRARELDVMLGERTFRGILRLILCWLGSVAIGYTVFGDAIFHVDDPAFQFVATGAIAGTFAAFATSFRSKGQLGVLMASHGIRVDDQVLKYDGRPFSVGELRGKVMEVLK